jgi:hypothetical protein
MKISLKTRNVILLCLHLQRQQAPDEQQKQLILEAEKEFRKIPYKKGGVLLNPDEQNVVYKYVISHA